MSKHCIIANLKAELQYEKSLLDELPDGGWQSVAQIDIIEELERKLSKALTTHFPHYNQEKRA